jgi:predicted Zn-dependent peptidase
VIAVIAAGAAVAAAAAAAAAAADGGAASVFPQPRHDEVTPRRTEMSGGAVLLDIPRSTAQAISFGVWVRCGSSSEQPHAAGVSHFLEHMVFRGTATRSALELAQTFDSVGAQVDAFTTKDGIAFTLKVLPEFFDIALPALADMVLRPALAPEAIALEQDVICEEIQEALDTPEDRLHDAYAAHVYGTHRRGRPILGTPESVRSFDQALLQQEHARIFRGSNLVLSVAGNLTPEVIGRIVEEFAAAPAAADAGDQVAADVSIAPEDRQPSELVIESPVLQTYFEIGNLGVPVSHPDRVAVLMLSNLLGGGMSSRVFQAVREREGLAYTVYNYTDMGRDVGLVSCAGSCSPDKEARVREVVAGEYRTLLRDGPTAEEIASNQAQIKSHILFALEGTHNQMARAAKNEIHFGRFLPIAELVAKVDAVDRDTLIRCARTWFDPDRLVHAAHRPASRH